MRCTTMIGPNGPEKMSRQCTKHSGHDGECDPGLRHNCVANDLACRMEESGKEYCIYASAPDEKYPQVSPKEMANILLTYLSDQQLVELQRQLDEQSDELLEEVSKHVAHFAPEIFAAHDLDQSIGDPSAPVAPEERETHRPQVKLLGEDGNVFAIIGLCSQAAKKAGWSSERVAGLRKMLMEAEDYEDVLRKVITQFEVI